MLFESNYIHSMMYCTNQNTSPLKTKQSESNDTDMANNSTMNITRTVIVEDQFLNKVLALCICIINGMVLVYNI